MKYKIQKNNKKKLLSIVTIAVVVLLLGGYTSAAYINNLWPFMPSVGDGSNDNTTQSANSTESINETTTNPTSSSSKDNIDNATTPQDVDNVSVVIVDAGQYERTVEVRAYINGVVESDGICTYSFTQGASTLTRQTTPSPSADTTSCATLSVNTPDFPALGTWNLIVSYKSAKFSGTSSTRTVEIK